MKYRRDYIYSELENFIKYIGINEQLEKCGSKWKIHPYLSEQERDYTVNKCYEKINDSWTSHPETKTWTFVASDEKGLGSYISFQIFFSIINGERDNMIYIEKVCTEKENRNLGLSKLLHWMVLKYGIYRGDIDYISVFVVSNIEAEILNSVGGISLTDEYETNVYITKKEEVRNEIYARHGIISDFIVPLDEIGQKMDKIKKEIITCKRPKN